MVGRAASRRATAARAVGVAGGAAGLAASLYLLFGPVARYERRRPDGTVTTGTGSGIDYLLGSAGADFALFAWPLLLGAGSALGGAAAWRRRDQWTSAPALALGVFAIGGGSSIGLLYAPAAVPLLAAALLGRV